MYYRRALSLIAAIGLMAGCQDQQTDITAPDPQFAQTEKEAETPSGLKITFLSWRDGDPNPELYVMHITGGHQTRLTNYPGWDGPARWSPDGERLLYYTERGDDGFLCIMNPDGSNENCVIEGGWNGAWSPDGKKIVFIRIADYLGELEDYEIHVANADGSGEIQLTDEPGNDGGPKWSPNGDKISFHSPRDGDWDIYLMNPDGSEVTRLTDNKCSDLQAAWSPDGSKLAFQSNCDGNPDVFVMNADGSGRVNLTNHPAQDVVPTWSPNGKEILFESNRDLGDKEVYVMKADGSKVRRLTNSPGSDGYMMDWGSRSQAEHEPKGWSRTSVVDRPPLDPPGLIRVAS